MTDERLNELFEYYGHVARCDLEYNCNTGVQHVKVLDLRALAPDMQTPERREKRMRWLGFVQGVLYAIGMFSVDELKNHSRPDYDAPVWEGE